jgi:hypothetical protein
MNVRTAMRVAAASYLAASEPVQAVFGARAASSRPGRLSGPLMLPRRRRCRIVVVTPARILVLDAGRVGARRAFGLVTELPRHTRLGPGRGTWHRVPAGQETRRVHRRFFRDLEIADVTASRPVWPRRP